MVYLFELISHVYQLKILEFFIKQQIKNYLWEIFFRKIQLYTLEFTNK